MSVVEGGIRLVEGEGVVKDCEGLGERGRNGG